MKTGNVDLASLRLDRDGAELWAGALDARPVEALRAIAPAPDDGRPGSRLTGNNGLAEHLSPQSAIGRIAAAALGPLARPVRAVMFDKTPAANWAVAWHQDRTIAVRERLDIGGFGPWSRKGGAVHVAPPVSVLERMVTLRAHLDACGDDNAPLQVALGSHRLGLVPADQAGTQARARESATCLASVGDVWAYRTLILHASDKATRPVRRRVLQVDFAAFDLPAGLVWSGIEGL